ncbi:MAG: hypothetical protein PVSMB7_09470 [Chloroflexota bacterium]
MPDTFDHRDADRSSTGRTPASRAGGSQPPSERLTVQGVVLESLPNSMFSVQIENGHKVLGHISEKLRIRYIRLVPGDHVTVEISPYNLGRGRITKRHP